jgi:hypothetical protein
LSKPKPSKSQNCDHHNCRDRAVWAFYPDQRRKVELAYYLCDLHRDVVTAEKSPNAEMYGAVALFVRNSIV